MYEIDLVLIVPKEYTERHNQILGAIESAADHYVSRKRMDAQIELNLGMHVILRIDRIISKNTSVDIKRSLLSQFVNLGIVGVWISIKSKKIRFWEEHAKSIAFFLGLTSLAGLVVGIAAWGWHDDLSEILKIIKDSALP